MFATIFSVGDFSIYDRDKETTSQLAKPASGFTIAKSHIPLQ